MSVSFRRASVADAARVAALHADSWRRHYRGAYADAYLDGDLVAERRSVWAARLASPPAPCETVLAEQGGTLVGFVHVVFDEHPRWGSLVDNLHVAYDRKRGGIGARLLTHAAAAVVQRAAGAGLHLWVMRGNAAAQAFYRAMGGRCVETGLVSAPLGDPGLLDGRPEKLRMAWADAALLAGRPSGGQRAVGAEGQQG